MMMMMMMMMMMIIIKKTLTCDFFLPTKHWGVLIKSFKRARAFQIELNFRSVGF